LLVGEYFDPNPVFSFMSYRNTPLFLYSELSLFVANLLFLAISIVTRLATTHWQYLQIVLKDIPECWIPIDGYFLGYL
jgi:hypothetical protein